MDQWLKKIVRQVQTTPPQCLRGFQLVPPKKFKAWNEMVAWQLTCECGGKQGQVLGHPLKEYNTKYHGPELFVSPLAFNCTACGKLTEIIDTDLHGYDAEVGKMEDRKFSVTIRGKGKRQPFPCSECSATNFTVTVIFMHPHFDLIEDEPELEPRSQDFFDAFDCLGVCIACGKESRIANFELA